MADDRTIAELITEAADEVACDLAEYSMFPGFQERVVAEVCKALSIDPSARGVLLVAPHPPALPQDLTDAQKPLWEKVLSELLSCYGEGEDTDWPYLTDLAMLIVSLIERHAAGLTALVEQHDYEAQVMFFAQQRWQGMAEDLWEELQEWHDADCPTQPMSPVRFRADGTVDHRTDCICHRILAAKWDELTHAADYADEEDA